MTERPEELMPPADTAALEKALAEARAKADEYLTGWQRAQADLINYKRRLEQDKEEAIKYAQSGLILKILPMLDDFERAMAALPPTLADHPWVKGIAGIARKLWNTLESQGLSEIKSQGEFFDPCLHEAVTCAPGEEGLVVEEFQKGYKLHDRVLRPAKVAVGSGEDTEVEPSMED